MGNGFRSLVLAGLFVFSGCTYVNEPLNDDKVQLEDRQHNQTRAETFSDFRPVGSPSPEIATASDRLVRPTSQPSVKLVHDDDGYFVGLALSGGGSRSANFSAACMFQLQRVGLLQKVDYISSVSGGSLAAAYYCLNDADWNPKTAQEKLTHSFASDIITQLLLPWDWFALIFTDYDRSDLLANTLNANLYSRKGKQLTYADLRSDRPRLLINATDLQNSRRFIFCNAAFDEINTDLSKYPIAYAVAASSSVPVLLHQVTLRDFSTTFTQYRHMVDGGVSDNLGIESLVETYRAHEDTAKQLGLPDPYPNGAIFIIIDARTQSDAKISTQGDPGFFASLKTAAGLSTAALVNRASAATLDDVIVRNAADSTTAKDIRDALIKLSRDGYIDISTLGRRKVRVAHLSLGQLHQVERLPFKGFTESVNSISTYFNITDEEAENLYLAANLLMRDRFEEKFIELRQEMDAAATQPTTQP